MDKKEISGMVKELDEALEQVAESRKPPRIKAWKQPKKGNRRRRPEEEYFDEPDPVEGPEEVRRSKQPEPEEVRRPKQPEVKEARDGRQPEMQEPSGFSAILRPSDSLLAAFFIPVILLVVIFALKGIFPFGTESFLRTDMYHQYAPFFSEFQHKLTEGGSLLYSWDIGMGVNFAALYAYYLASPLNWLLLLCPKAYIIEFMTYMIVLKTGLSGLTFTWYLREHNRSERFGACFFGIFYAMSGYMAAYSWNIMWLDCILLFPVIMLGLERLVKEKKGLLYCVSLGLSILSNYYISIMICMFMVIYYFCLLILEDRRSVKDFFGSGLRFGWYSLLAGALAGVVLLPEIAALQSTASGDFNFPKTFEQYFPIMDMLARHIGNVQTETGLDHWPNIYCGVAVYLFFLLYLACKKIPVKEKAVYCGLLLFFFASFSVNVLNFIWHGFHYPNSLPCRQSFIYIFLILCMCYRAYQYLEETPKKHVALAFWGSAGFVLWAQQRLTEDEAYHFAVFYVAILFLALYAGLIYYYKNLRNSVTTAAILAMGLVAIESSLNMAVTSVTTTSRTTYQGDNKAIIRQTEALLEESGAHGGFFRFDRNDARTKNDGAWMNFPSVSLFSSLAHADMTDFFKEMGCEGSTNAYSMVGSTPLTDSLFSVRYSVYNGEQENLRLVPQSNFNEIYVYENPYTLPLGFLMPDIMENGWKWDLETPADVQNSLTESLDAPPAFEYVSGESDGKKFTFTAEADGEYYIAVTNKKVKTITLDIGESSDTVKNVNRGFLIETGYLKAGETVTLENKDGSDGLDAVAYRFCIEGLQGVYERLNANPLTVTVWEDDYLEGVIDAGEGGTLFLSIPYDEGWTVMADGREVTTRKVLNAFTGLELPAGTHTLSLSYFPKGLKEGVMVSGAALFLLLLSFLFTRASGKRKEPEIDGDEWD